ncbi:MAG: DUF4215 domain-containing protein, partial [Myxococcota bacterium]
VCGDSHVGPEEQCDLGEFANGDDGENCTEFCTLNTCGDGQRGPTEECDAGPLNGTNGQDCTATCRMTTCGDGQLGTSEACDDGNSSSFDGCSESCLVENCRDFDLSAFNCPTGATQFCSSELPLSGNCPSTLNNALALAACVTCLGADAGCNNSLAEVSACTPNSGTPRTLVSVRGGNASGCVLNFGIANFDETSCGLESSIVATGTCNLGLVGSYCGF